MPRTLPKRGLSPWFNKPPALLKKYENNILRRATVTVIARNASAANFLKIKYILRDLSKIGPVLRILFCYALKFVKRLLCFHCVCDFYA